MSAHSPVHPPPSGWPSYPAGWPPDPSSWPSDPAGWPSDPEGQVEGSEGLLEGFEGLLEGSEGWLEGSEGQPAGSEGQPAGSEGQPEGGRPYEQTEFLPILQDFVPVARNYSLSKIARFISAGFFLAGPVFEQLNYSQTDIIATYILI